MLSLRSWGWPRRSRDNSGKGMSLEDALEAPTGCLHQVGASRLPFSHEMGRLKAKGV